MIFQMNCDSILIRIFIFLCANFELFKIRYLNGNDFVIFGMSFSNSFAMLKILIRYWGFLSLELSKKWRILLLNDSKSSIFQIEYKQI